MRLIADALPDRFRRSPQTNNQRVVSQTGKVSVIDDQTPTCRDNQMPLRREFRHHLALRFAEGLFALFCKNSADRFVRPRFDKLIRVHKGKVQLPGNNPANRRFASSHKAHESQVVELPVTNHDSVLAQIGGKFKVQTSHTPATQRKHPGGNFQLENRLQNFIFKGRLMDKDAPCLSRPE